MKTRTQHGAKFYYKVLKLSNSIVITICLLNEEVASVSGPGTFSYGSFNRVRNTLAKTPNEMVVALGVSIYYGINRY